MRFAILMAVAVLASCSQQTGASKGNGNGGNGGSDGGASSANGGSASGGAAGTTVPDAGAGGGAGSGGTPVVGPVKRYIYEGMEGSAGNRIGVFDIDSGHRMVKVIGPLSGADGDLRGIAANARLHAIYLSYQSLAGGRVIAMDLHTDQVLWSKDLQPGADRGDVSIDGTKLYVPGGEDFLDNHEFVLDPKTGDVIDTLAITSKPHDTDVGISGKYAYLETKSSPIVSLVDVATNKIIRDLTFGNVVGPHVVNGNDTLVAGNVMQYFGFELMDVATGQVIARVHADGVAETPDENPIALKNHAIAWKPDETEIWLGSKFHPDLFVYDMAVMPPKQIKRINPGGGYHTNHWITFSIKGDFVYPSPDQNTQIPVQVIDSRTYAPVATMPYSEQILEVDFADGKVVAVGNQYGIGRKPAAP